MAKARYVVAALVTAGLITAAWKIHDAEKDEKARSRRKVRKRKREEAERAAQAKTG